MGNLYQFSKLLLKRSYKDSINCYVDKSKKNYLSTKYKHSIETVKIANKIYNLKTQQEKCIYLLHDIGRFRAIIDSKENVEHAFYGYEYLKKLNTFDEKNLIPILLHETDLGWQEKLSTLKSYQLLKQEEKDIVLLNIKRLKDADILSNMIEKLRYTSVDDVLNNEIYNCLLQNKICEKDFDGNINRAMYIICGIYILTTQESLSFIKQSGIIKKYFDKVITKTNNIELKNKLLRCKEHLIEKGFI